MDKELRKLADSIIWFAHENCALFEEKHRTDEEALDNSHESFWLEFIEDGEDENLFNEEQFYKAFDLAYDLVKKGN